jgi:hypothetical protein
MLRCKIPINSAVTRAFQRCMGRGGVRAALERYVSRTVFWQELYGSFKIFVLTRYIC